jgi:hypothetical protein
LRSLSVQVQPERSPGIDIAGLTDLFQSLVSRTDLVRHHSFDHGFDKGAYYNFTFGTERPAELWQLIQSTIFQAPEHRAHMALCAMAVCSSEEGWHRYSQLYHWDSEVPLDSLPTL